MKYSVIIRRCPDRMRAAFIAKHIADWSGCRYKNAWEALMSKSVCIRKEADENEAYALRKQFEDFGAKVHIIPAAQVGHSDAPSDREGKRGGALTGSAPMPEATPERMSEAEPSPAVKTARMGEPKRAQAVDTSASGAMEKATAQMGGRGLVRSGSYEEEEEEQGRLLTDQEYAEQMRRRTDIFFVEEDSRLRNLEVVCVVLGLVLGVWLSTREIIDTPPDFFEKLDEREVTFAPDVPLPPEEPEPEPEPPKPPERQEPVSAGRRVIKPSKSQGLGERTSGGGDPRERVTREGFLGIVAGHIKGKAIASADPFGKGGVTDGIDAMLSGMGGLKDGADGGSGRKGIAGIGFGKGYNSGIGGGSGGVDDLLAGLMPGDPAASLGLRTKGPRERKINIPGVPTGGALVGGRSKASIMRVVMQNLAALRHAYNKRLREKPGLKGKVTVKFAIDEFGNVIFCEVIDSTLEDDQFRTLVVSRVKRWVFDEIDKPGDVTEVVYPFVFSQ
ncbi:MAG: AgmX/PglI C-terminal domain-containing protein [Chitinivibrionales bacterium]